MAALIIKKYAGLLAAAFLWIGPALAGYRGSLNLCFNMERGCFQWNSEDLSQAPKVVDGSGGLGEAPQWDLDVMVSPDKIITYRNYAQGARTYGDYSDYIAMHGCALCCTTTVIRAWYPEEDWNPEKVISRLEPQADGEGYEKNYAKPIRSQMPLSLKGISRILTLKEIPHRYVTEPDEETLAEDLTEVLKKGRPVIYEAGNGGYHMLLLLGVTAEGDFVLSDSVGSYRIRLISPQRVKEQIFPCKKDPEKSYFAGRKTAGGYIVVGEE